jgi:hypothetical protein
MYFNQFPLLQARFLGNYAVVTDIFRRVASIFAAKNLYNLETTAIEQGETPELLAYKIYGREDYHWVLLIVNNIIDVREEWPRNESDLYKYCLDKYGEDNIYTAIHHYRTTDIQVEQGIASGLIVDYDGVELANGNIEAITNWDYEVELNDKKREIKYVPPKYLSKFVNEFKKLIS